MGFRSTFVTEDFPVRWPQWFREKYSGSVHISEAGLLSAKLELPIGRKWSELAEDIRKAIAWDGPEAPERFVVVFLHECGGISRVQITRDGVRFSVPTGWEETDILGHSYCYGCSDLPPKDS